PWRAPPRYDRSCHGHQLKRCGVWPGRETLSVISVVERVGRRIEAAATCRCPASLGVEGVGPGLLVDETAAAVLEGRALTACPERLPSSARHRPHPARHGLLSERQDQHSQRE